ncbi:aprataxin [Schizosaccharomyces japonicus yFS275]|uniref:Aprataxin n=1 Tax=Schizosaccharomyces japonicus (strain yFS275 / FY16936) TaxID=402676 RepID=B6K6S2_SCHJY|nr:aprataxin [Schizosaccharomyces japonicus yFS275]EEB09226.2 aprataxin [Schizosaccharomyces japonicus yFS275]
MYIMPKEKNAFKELMSRKLSVPDYQNPSSNDRLKKRNYFDKSTRSYWGTHLRKYLLKPEAESNVLYFDDSYVLIRDAYPKAQVHLLLIPRDQDVSKLHPYEIIRTRPDIIKKLLQLINGDLKSIILKEARSTVYQDIETVDEEEIWNFLNIGFHSKPSEMNLHVHIISKDSVSSSMKKPLHYILFHTEYFIPLTTEAQNLPDITQFGDQFMKQDLVCWRCKCSFQRKFSSFKEHLNVELATYKELTLQRLAKESTEKDV